jgi:hypothetical protein
LPSSDAENVIREFFAYAIERRRDGVMDFAAIVEGFRRALQGDSSKDGAFSRKVLKIMREFLATDPKYQKRLFAQAQGRGSAAAAAADVQVDGLLADDRQQH